MRVAGFVTCLILVEGLCHNFGKFSDTSFLNPYASTGSKAHPVSRTGRRALPNDRTRLPVPILVATDLVKNGPWFIEMSVGSEEARRLGSDGRIVGLNAPDITFGPFKLTFRKNGAAILEEVVDQSMNMCFANTASWFLGSVGDAERAETGLPPGSAFLEMRFVAKERFSIPGDVPWEWKTYIPEGDIITATTYVQHDGKSIRRMGAFALTSLESEWFKETYKIVGRISRFSNTLVIGSDDDIDDPVSDPEFQDAILAIEKALRDASGAGSKQTKQQLLRKLIVEWHPDKQLDNPNPELAAKIFRWLQSTRQKLGQSGR